MTGRTKSGSDFWQSGVLNSCFFHHFSLSRVSWFSCSSSRADSSKSDLERKSRDRIFSVSTESWYVGRAKNKVKWEKTESKKRRVEREKDLIPEKFQRYDEEFDQVVDFQQQLESLKTSGFLRHYKPYSPPEDLDAIFQRVCASKMPEQFAQGTSVDLPQIKLSGPLKARVLSALQRELKHEVPNSLLHTLTSLDEVLRFFSTPVDVRTPYEKLHEDRARGKLPKNLHVQLDPLLYNQEDDHPLHKVTALPQENEILVTPEERKLFKERPKWEGSPYDKREMFKQD